MANSPHFLPFIRQGAGLIQKMIPQPLEEKNKIFKPKYLENHFLETPSLAFANARREVIRMAEMAYSMFEKTIIVFKKNDTDLMISIEEEDDKIDILDREIKFYLSKISQEDLTAGQSHHQLSLFTITTDLEDICDVINKNILELAEKKIRKNLHFSQEGWGAIQDVHSKVLENFQIMLSTLTTKDETLVRKILRHEKYLILWKDKCYASLFPFLRLLRNSSRT